MIPESVVRAAKEFKEATYTGVDSIMPNMSAMLSGNSVTHMLFSDHQNKMEILRGVYMCRRFLGSDGAIFITDAKYTMYERRGEEDISQIEKLTEEELKSRESGCGEALILAGYNGYVSVAMSVDYKSTPGGVQWGDPKEFGYEAGVGGTAMEVMRQIFKCGTNVEEGIACVVKGELPEYEAAQEYERQFIKFIASSGFRLVPVEDQQ